MNSRKQNTKNKNNDLKQFDWLPSLPVLWQPSWIRANKATSINIQYVKIILLWSKEIFGFNIHFVKIWIYTQEGILSFISYRRFSFIYIIFFEFRWVILFINNVFSRFLSLNYQKLEILIYYERFTLLTPLKK